MIETEIEQLRRLENPKYWYDTEEGQAFIAEMIAEGWDAAMVDPRCEE